MYLWIWIKINNKIFSVGFTHLPLNLWQWSIYQPIKADYLKALLDSLKIQICACIFFSLDMRTWDSLSNGYNSRVSRTCVLTFGLIFAWFYQGIVLPFLQREVFSSCKRIVTCMRCGLFPIFLISAMLRSCCCTRVASNAISMNNVNTE